MGKSTLQAISYLAPNWFGFYQAVTGALARSLGSDIQLRQGEWDPLDDPGLLQDQWDLVFICGLPFMRHHQTRPDQFQVLAAPVMQACRYRDRPIYFSDVVVNRASGIERFEELAGKVFGYNDLGSNSGYNLVRWHLLHNRFRTDFWAACVPSGSHQRSLEWVMEGRVDWAAIDSIVLEQALRDHPEWCNRVKVIAAIGPSPMPPILAATHLGPTRIQTLQAALLYPDQTLKTAMAMVGVERYARQSWQDYTILAEMYAAVNSNSSGVNLHQSQGWFRAETG